MPLTIGINPEVLPASVEESIATLLGMRDAPGTPGGLRNLPLNLPRRMLQAAGAFIAPYPSVRRHQLTQAEEYVRSNKPALDEAVAQAQGTNNWDQAELAYEGIRKGLQQFGLSADAADNMMPGWGNMIKAQKLRLSDYGKTMLQQALKQGRPIELAPSVPVTLPSLPERSREEGLIGKTVRQFLPDTLESALMRPPSQPAAAQATFAPTAPPQAEVPEGWEQVGGTPYMVGPRPQSMLYSTATPRSAEELEMMKQTIIDNLNLTEGQKLNQIDKLEDNFRSFRMAQRTPGLGWLYEQGETGPTTPAEGRSQEGLYRPEPYMSPGGGVGFRFAPMEDIQRERRREEREETRFGRIPPEDRRRLDAQVKSILTFKDLITTLNQATPETVTGQTASLSNYIRQRLLFNENAKALMEMNLLPVDAVTPAERDFVAKYNQMLINLTGLVGEGRVSDEDAKRAIIGIGNPRMAVARDLITRFTVNHNATVRDYNNQLQSLQAGKFNVGGYQSYAPIEPFTSPPTDWKPVDTAPDGTTIYLTPEGKHKTLDGRDFEWRD